MKNKENEVRQFEIDEYSKKVFDIEFVESPNSVDLRSCIRGQKLIARDGSVMYYKEPLEEGNYFDHLIWYDEAKTKVGSRTHAGKTLKASEMDSDITEIIRE